MKMNQRGFVNTILVVIVVIIILAGAVGYFALVKKTTPIAKQTPALTPTPKPETTSWKTYTNSRFGFQLTLTDAWKNYKVFSSEGSQGVGAPTYLDFSLSTTDKLRSVTSVTDSIYGYAAPLKITIIAKDRNYQGTGIKITQDSDNAYYYTVNDNLPDDLKQINFEIPRIISTFKLKK